MRENSRTATFAEEPVGNGGSEPDPWRGPFSDETAALEAHWKAFGRFATGIAIVTAPLFFTVLNYVLGMGIVASIITALVAAMAFRGVIDVISRRFIPSPSLFADDGSGRERDITDRRRTAFWRFWFKIAAWLAVIYVVSVIAILLVQAYTHRTDLGDAIAAPWNYLADTLGGASGISNVVQFGIYIVALFLVNTLIFLGPLMIVGIRQVKAYEPGDVDWGVRMEDVRGQASAKESIRQIVTLWQSGDEYEAAGGKRERGMLFIGAPGTGKTMLAKSIAARFNSPLVTAPGPAFAQSFIGVDVMIVMWIGWRARRLARKWGGHCIVFIDEIDAIGGARSHVIGTGAIPTVHDVSFHGPMGALTSSGDLVLETPEWRDRLFAERAAAARPGSSPSGLRRALEGIRQFAFPGLDGGTSFGGGLQQLLIEMDGVRAPSLVRRFLVNRINTVLDSAYVIPTRIGQLPLRLRAAKPRKEELFFIGACNVPRSALDPALTRAGRMGYVVNFRTPNVPDRADIIDLYLNRIRHEESLATPERIDELARMTVGYSPAMIEQGMSLALARAHFNGRAEANWNDVVMALTGVAWGDDRQLEYIPEEERETAIHEAGHAIAGHVYMSDWASSRLSIRPRGDSYGHHAMAPVNERHLGLRRHKFADLIWTLGAMAAEEVMFGENSVGVGGDLDHATSAALMMVGVWGMRTELPDLDAYASNSASRAGLERRLKTRFQEVGLRMMNRAHTPSILGGYSLSAVQEDEGKRNEAAVFIGMAFMTAYWLMRHNRAALETVADTILEKKEMFGDEVVRLLDRLNITIPDINPLDESNWPRI